jgi:hypothetical protein
MISLQHATRVNSHSLSVSCVFLILKRSKSTLPSSRPVRWWERLRDFPVNVGRLYQDFLRVKDIYDASHTPNNAWTNRYGVMGRIPRRQQEQERQLVSDMRIVVPLLVLWIPPIIGYLPLFIAVGCPRQVLSRHFFNIYEQESFAILEMKQRQEYYSDLANYTWATLAVHHGNQVSMPPRVAEDAAGPCWDLVEQPDLVEKFVRTNLVHCEALPREHLNTLALAMGYAQRFPPPISRLLVACSPSLWVAREMKELAYRIGRDDRLCLEENYHLDGCQGMTDAEVREACLLRGLPVHVTYDEMRECLTNHLTMVEILWKNKSQTVPRQHLQIFALYLPAMRKYCRRC